mmetsp:Transcript_6569/g.15668  ORF Transcript_6569/g.15668 Transcript_6569/m.15668 type:complete len:276 (+) Transcript_6569:2944-3771(+)
MPSIHPHRRGLPRRCNRLLSILLRTHSRFASKGLPEGLPKSVPVVFPRENSRVSCRCVPKQLRRYCCCCCCSRRANPSPEDRRHHRLESLVGTKKDETADGDPHHAGLDAAEKDRRFPVGVLRRRPRHHVGDPPVGDPVLVRAHHQPRLDDVEGRRRGRGQGAAETPAGRGLERIDGDAAPQVLGPVGLEKLVDRELDHREWNLPHQRDPVSPVEAARESPERPAVFLLGQDQPEGPGEGRCVGLAGLHLGLEDLGGDADQAGRRFSHRGRNHVR